MYGLLIVRMLRIYFNTAMKESEFQISIATQGFMMLLLAVFWCQWFPLLIFCRLWVSTLMMPRSPIAPTIWTLVMGVSFSCPLDAPVPAKYPFCERIMTKMVWFAAFHQFVEMALKPKFCFAICISACEHDSNWYLLVLGSGNRHLRRPFGRDLWNLVGRSCHCAGVRNEKITTTTTTVSVDKPRSSS